MGIIYINGEESITSQGSLDKINHHQTPRRKSKVNISLWRRKSYQIIDLEEIYSRFYQVRSVVSHLSVCLPKKPPTPNNIGKALIIPQRQLQKEVLFVKYDKNKNVSLISDPIPIKSLPDGTKVFPLILLLRKVTVLMHGIFLHVTIQMGVLILNLLVLINHTFQWHMLTYSSYTLLSQIWIDSLTGF